MDQAHKIVTWTIQSTSRMCDRNLLPRPCKGFTESHHVASGTPHSICKFSDHKKGEGIMANWQNAEGFYGVNQDWFWSQKRFNSVSLVWFSVWVTYQHTELISTTLMMWVSTTKHISESVKTLWLKKCALTWFLAITLYKHHHSHYWQDLSVQLQAAGLVHNFIWKSSSTNINSWTERGG